MQFLSGKHEERDRQDVCKGRWEDFLLLFIQMREEYAKAEKKASNSKMDKGIPK